MLLVQIKKQGKQKYIQKKIFGNLRSCKDYWYDSNKSVKNFFGNNRLCQKLLESNWHLGFYFKICLNIPFKRLVLVHCKFYIPFLLALSLMVYNLLSQVLFIHTCLCIRILWPFQSVLQPVCVFICLYFRVFVWNLLALILLLLKTHWIYIKL